jgi:hypothetical protein
VLNVPLGFMISAVIPKRVRQLFVWALAIALSDCSLNPQPLPPSMGGDLSANGGATPTQAGSPAASGDAGPFVDATPGNGPGEPPSNNGEGGASAANVASAVDSGGSDGATACDLDATDDARFGDAACERADGGTD